MIIFVTGATGLVGSHCINEFLNQGFQVKALVRNKSDLTVNNNLEVFEGDVFDSAIIKKAMEGCDVVLHTAALVSFSSAKRDEMFLTNVSGTANIVNIALECNVEKFIHISSIAALGRAEKPTNFSLDESVDWIESSNNTAYAKSKYLSELEVWRGIEEGLNATILCPSVIIGEGAWARSSSKLFKYIYDQKPFYTLGNINYVDVKDVVSGVINAINGNFSAQKFILNSGTLSYKKFFDLVALKLNKRAPYIKVTKTLAYLAWIIESIKTIFSKAEPLITKETAKQSQHKYVYSNKKAVEVLGVEFTPLETSLDRICAWYLNYAKSL